MYISINLYNYLKLCYFLIYSTLSLVPISNLDDTYKVISMLFYHEKSNCFILLQKSGMIGFSLSKVDTCNTIFIDLWVYLSLLYHTPESNNQVMNNKNRHFG